MNGGEPTGVPDTLEAFYDALLGDDAERLYEYAPCGYLSTEPDGIIVRANTTFLTLTGYTRPELVGRYTFAQLLTPGGQIYHETHFAPLLRMQGTIRGIALDIVCADGSRLPVLVSAVLETDRNGTPRVVRTAVFDARERRDYERELVRAKNKAEESESHARSLARALQRTLIPPMPPVVPGLDVAAVYRPAGTGEEVGGDFYDVFQVAEDDWVVCIGDVCGKGVEAAVVTALVRYSLRASAVRVTLPSEMLRELNTALLRNRSDRFCTVGVLRLRRAEGIWSATVSSGGHPPAVLLRMEAPARPLGEPGSLLGVMDEVELHDATLALSAGDTVLLYTDGVPEARRNGDFYGEPRLVQVAEESLGRAAGLTEALLADVLAFQGGHARDDIAIVAVRVPRN
ncbi:MAG: phosphoserine phosphatase RsbU/P [Actinomycetota bacterium]|nr:phosphoserine phosphatase RsbU/P [Actinomycetota bacterium]